MSAWLPIKLAPKTLYSILGYDDISGEMEICHWVKGYGWVYSVVEAILTVPPKGYELQFFSLNKTVIQDMQCFKPTHWMPLPEPPNTDIEGEE